MKKLCSILLQSFLILPRQKDYIMRNLRFVFGIIAILAITGCGSEPRYPVTVHLIETTDVHGTIFPASPNQQSLAQVSYWIDSLRCKEGVGKVLLMDNGDILQGTPLIYVANFDDTLHTHWAAKALNYLDYDVASVGNHDIEAGHDVYDRYKQEVDFPLLAANAIDEYSNKPYFQPYTVIEKSGLRIAVLGLITPGVPGWLPKSLYEGIRFDDMVETAKIWVPKIIKEEQPDLLVGLFHAGGDHTYGGVDETYLNENASLLVAQNVPGFDAVFVGHDHRIWNETVVNNETGKKVYIIGAGSRSKQLGHLSVTFTDSGKIFRAQVVDLIEAPVDSHFVSQFDAEHQRLQAFISKPAGILAKPLSSANSFWQPTAFIDLIHQVQLAEAQADVSLTAPLSMHTSIPADTLLQKDLFELYRFENYINGVKMYGRELDAYLEYSYGGWFRTMTGADQNALNFALDSNNQMIYSERYGTYQLKNRYYNFDAAAGVKYTVDLTKPGGERVTILSMTNGEKFHPDSLYKVAVNSYRASGGGGHFERGARLSSDEMARRTYFSSNRDLRYYLAQYLKAHSPYQPEIISDWQLLPKEWVTKAQVKDERMLFGTK